MSGHTKGPWKTAPEQLGSLGGVIMGGEKAVAIATHRNNEVEYRANARLISAAPDMLESLEAIAGINPTKQADPTDAIESARAIAAEAIAKATGADQ